MKLLIHPEKREVIDGRERVIAQAKEYFVADFSKDFHTAFGIVSKEDLGKPSGSVVKTHTDKEFVLLDAGFTDIFKQFKKLPQTIPLKDIAYIIGETGINKDSVIVDGGAGSGALAAVLGHVAKHVTSYDVREEHITAAQKNLDKIGVKNVVLKHASLYDGIEEKNVDVITLDVPEPWRVILHAFNALKVGGFLVSYSPTVPQVQQFVEEAGKDFLIVKTAELIERPWVVDGKRVRPNNSEIGHSGFITIVRKITA